MYDITIFYIPDDQIVAVPDSDLLKEADGIIKDAQIEAVHVETSTWTLIEWIRAQACQAGSPEKVSVHYQDKVYTVNEYGAMIGLPYELPVHATFIASEKVLRFALERRRRKSEARIDLAMQLHEQVENMLLREQSPLQICKALHATVPGITIDEGKAVIERVKEQSHHKRADYAD